MLRLGGADDAGLFNFSSWTETSIGAGAEEFDWVLADGMDKGVLPPEVSNCVEAATAVVKKEDKIRKKKRKKR